MKTERTCGLYVIRCAGNGSRYFGSAVNIAQRWRQHRYDLRKGRHSNTRMQRTWNKYGELSFSFSVLVVLERDDRLETERKLLATVRDDPATLNMSACPTGGMTGRRHSPETRERLAAIKRGSRHSAETRGRMRASQSRRTNRPETGPAISSSLRAWNATHPRTPEYRERVRKALLGKKHNAERRAKTSQAITAWWAKRKETV